MATSAPRDVLDRAQPRTARIAIATIFFVNGAVLANWIARIPDIKQRLELSEGSLGIALLCMAAGALVAQIMAGWLMAKHGSRRITLLMALLFCVTTVLPGAATNLILLMLALLLFGAGNGGLDVAMNSQAALVEQVYGRPIMTSFHGLWSVGALFGASVGGLIAAQQLPVEQHLLGVAVIGGVVLFVATRHLIVDKGNGSTSGSAFVLPPRSLIPMGIIAFSALFCEGAIADWSAIYLRETLGSTPGLAVAGYVAFALLMTIVRLTGDWLTLRLGALLLVRGGGALITLGIGLILVSQTPVIAIIGFGLIGAGAACIFPLVLSAAAKTPNLAPGTAIAAIATAGYTGSLVGPPLIGSVAEVLTLRGALGTLGLVGLLIMLFGSAVQGRQQT